MNKMYPSIKSIAMHITKKGTGTYHIYLVTIMLVMVFTGACTPSEPDNERDINMLSPVLVDQNATEQTHALFVNMERIRHDHILFGHQDDLAYGVHWINEPGRSDVLEVTGSYPALYGWELGHIEHGAEMNLDNVDFEQMKGWIREGYGRGGVITLSWHPDNPLTGGSSWDVEGGQNVIAGILPGGERHDIFRSWLDQLADFMGDLIYVDEEGNSHPIPVIFRPWHEMSAGFFWWGDPYSSHEEYRQLYRFTVEYLRDEKSINHILWAFSPNSFSEYEYETEYWNWYPGDEYVDILGFDDYYTTWGGYGHEDGVAKLTEYLVWMVEQAEARGKIPALTETGQENCLADADWYTNQLLAAITGHPTAQRIAYLLTWRNSNNATDRQNHFYTPYPGHPAEADFVTFVNHPLILMESDLPDMYSID